LGESAQILTGGLLEATPHCVVRGKELAGTKISRNTFALFMQPDPLEIMKVPEGINPEEVTKKVTLNLSPIN
jgi:isopenicillin N synthase-like dioxygenase